MPEVRLHTRCEIKVSDFPFDTQCCEISVKEKTFLKFLLIYVFYYFNAFLLVLQLGTHDETNENSTIWQQKRYQHNSFELQYRVDRVRYVCVE